MSYTSGTFFNMPWRSMADLDAFVLENEVASRAAPRVAVARDRPDPRLVALVPLRMGQLIYVERAERYVPSLMVPSREKDMLAFLNFGARPGEQRADELTENDLNTVAQHRLAAILKRDVSQRGLRKAFDALADYVPTLPAPDELSPASLYKRCVEIAETCAFPAWLAAVNTTTGFGIWPLSMRIEHSCDPNAIYLSHGRYMLVFAQRDIAVGEAITVSYLFELPYISSRETRIALIKASYGSTEECCCDRCERERLAPLTHVWDAELDAFEGKLVGFLQETAELFPWLTGDVAVQTQPTAATLISMLTKASDFITTNIDDLVRSVQRARDHDLPGRDRCCFLLHLLGSLMVGMKWSTWTDVHVRRVGPDWLMLFRRLSMLTNVVADVYKTKCDSRNLLLAICPSFVLLHWMAEAISTRQTAAFDVLTAPCDCYSTLAASQLFLINKRSVLAAVIDDKMQLVEKF